MTQPGVYNCTNQAFLGGDLESYFNTNCYNTTSCTIDLYQYFQNTTDYYDCYGETSRVFMQYLCLQSDDELLYKRNEGLGIVCLGCFAMSIYMLAVFYLDHTADLDYKLWDLSTTTAADFTAEMTIHPDQYNQLLITMSRIAEPMPTHAVPSMTEMRKPIVALAQHIENEFCRKLNKLPKVIRDEPNMRIAHISFAFDNKELLQALIERGTLITKGAFDKLAKVNEKIDKMYENDREKLSTPVAAFITFETQEAFERAMFYFPMNPGDREVDDEFLDPVTPDEKQFLGRDLKLMRATEPSNMIWENRHTTKKEIYCRSFFVAIAIVILLIGALALFTVMSALTVTN